MQHGLFSDHVMQRLVRITRRYINENKRVALYRTATVLILANR